MNEHVALRPMADSYTVDVHAWTQAQVELLRASRFDLVDVENIIEEIESLGNEIEHAIESHLVVALEHLIKLAVSADRNPRRLWQTSVANARGQIERRLRKNPSLRRKLPAMFADVWPDARRQARLGLREAEESFVPTNPPFTLAEALDPDFFPGD
ncbi:DUF29 domain-containing protein [Polymorphobacter megasporae]|uniref:DUF29 domain-containing protein n=1 Tax=Glacieibacterium megasporae TaxID=2835787 RepID=UPI001C1E3996|nr:DUF29 domain-containing protein [Polymorphobacter megasporae]UAJ11795.1 DUF29 domain-containing protein [Polymorphobacter megasporae]